MDHQVWQVCRWPLRICITNEACTSIEERCRVINFDRMGVYYWKSSLSIGPVLALLIVVFLLLLFFNPLIVSLLHSIFQIRKCGVNCNILFLFSTMTNILYLADTEIKHFKRKRTNKRAECRQVSGWDGLQSLNIALQSTTLWGTAFLFVNKALRYSNAWM